MQKGIGVFTLMILLVWGCKDKKPVEQISTSVRKHASVNESSELEKGPGTVCYYRFTHDDPTLTDDTFSRELYFILPAALSDTPTVYRIPTDTLVQVVGKQAGAWTGKTAIEAITGSVRILKSGDTVVIECVDTLKGKVQLPGGLSQPITLLTGKHRFE